MKANIFVLLLALFGGIIALSVAFLYLMPADAAVRAVQHSEKVAVHFHVTVDGAPAYVGISKNLWHDHSLDKYGANGFAPLHTHDSSGQVHIESKERRNFTLGDFLSIWGVEASSACLVVPADGGTSIGIGISGGCQQLGDGFADTVLQEGQHFRIERK
jgi:hypothetical protein